MCLEHSIVRLELKQQLLLSSSSSHVQVSISRPSTVMRFVLAVLTQTRGPSFLSLPILCPASATGPQYILSIRLSYFPPHCQVTFHSTCRCQQKCPLFSKAFPDQAILNNNNPHPTLWQDSPFLLLCFMSLHYNASLSCYLFVHYLTYTHTHTHTHKVSSLRDFI